MPTRKLLDAQGNGTSIIELPVRSSQAEVSLGGPFGGATVTLQDKKHDLDWADVLDANTGLVLEITEPTNEVELISASNTSRLLRGVVAGGDGSESITAYLDEGVL